MLRGETFQSKECQPQKMIRTKYQCLFVSSSFFLLQLLEIKALLVYISIYNRCKQSNGAFIGCYIKSFLLILLSHHCKSLIYSALSVIAGDSR